MDPVGHILEIFEIFGIGIGHSGRLYGSGPGFAEILKYLKCASKIFLGHTCKYLQSNSRWFKRKVVRLVLDGSFLVLINMVHFPETGD